MREIKFRAWDIERKVMVGASGSLQDKFSIRSDGITKESYIIEQFTGLKDKNGKDIWEGDLVGLSDTSYFGDYEVRFNAGHWELYTDNESGNPNSESLYDWQSYCEVIGNIHEDKS